MHKALGSISIAAKTAQKNPPEIIISWFWTLITPIWCH
jgi:hypothetical protein